jgi:peptidoglycan/LPS O-acetylase OafA/YrhL
MGLYRLALSLIVVMFHFGGYPPLAGRVAVFAFFCLSGYLMALVIERAYGFGIGGWMRFYLNRALRLVPLFLAIIALTLLILDARGGRYFFIDPFEGLFLNVEKGPDVLRSGLALKFDVATLPVLSGSTSLVPQSWSLVIEGFFYASAPLLALIHSRARPAFYLLMVASLALNVYVLAAGLDFGTWVYQNYFAALWVFLLGMTLYYERARFAGLPWKNLVAGVTFGAFFILVARSPEVNVELGFYVGIPLAACLTVVLAQVRWPPRLRRIDRFAGDLAYGVFLNHFAAALLVLTANEFVLRERGTFNFFGRVNQVEFGHWTATVSLVLAAAMFMLIERPMQAWRDRVRRLEVPADAPLESPAMVAVPARAA